VKAVLRYQHTRSRIHELQTGSNPHRICGFFGKEDIPEVAIVSRVFAEFAAGNLGMIVNNADVSVILR
jgi:hypothetical protein